MAHQFDQQEISGREVPHLSTLYRDNTLERFWQLEAGHTAETRRVAIERAAALLPDGATALARGGWDGLMEHLLGEGQFGPDRYRLGFSKRLYYALRPLLPRPATALLRRRYRTYQEEAFPLGWPIEDRYVRFLHQIREQLADGASPAEHVCGARSTSASCAARPLWPGGAPFAFVLTHDVERADGQAFALELAALEASYGFRSLFNFVPERYKVDNKLLSTLLGRGFEIGVHGLKHDGKLFTSRSLFERRAARINAYLRAWGAVGFRSPLTLRHPEWMQALEIEYDSSFFDTDPYEPMPGGTMSIWPFFCGRFVELPYTMAQDHTLLVVKGERTPRLWLEKAAFVARWGGMALVNVHPDYMRDSAHWAVYEALLRHMAEQGGRASADQAAPTTPYWHALPRDVARWWRERAGIAAAPPTGADLDPKAAGVGGASASVVAGTAP